MVDVVGKEREREREREREMGVMRQKQVSVRARASSSSAPAYALRVGVVGGATRRVVRETRANAVYDNYEPIPNGPESWPVPEFIEKTVAAFPEKAIANDEEVRVLLDHGYKWLDVRSKPEYDEERTVGSVNIPIINATKKFNTETKDKELVQGKRNEDFMKQVEKKFPKKDAYILVGCSDGRNRAIQALQVRWLRLSTANERSLSRSTMRPIFCGDVDDDFDDEDNTCLPLCHSSSLSQSPNFSHHLLRRCVSLPIPVCVCMSTHISPCVPSRVPSFVCFRSFSFARAYVHDDDMQLLDEAGYTNIVGIKGGFNKYYTTFDAKNRRRVIDVMESVYTADGDPAGASNERERERERDTRVHHEMNCQNPIHQFTCSKVALPSTTRYTDNDAPCPTVIACLSHVHRHPRLGSSVRSNGCAAHYHQSR